MCGVGILLAEKWVEAIFDAQRVADKITLIRFVARSIAIAQSVFYDDSVKYLFYENLQWTPGPYLFVGFQ